MSGRAWGGVGVGGWLKGKTTGATALQGQICMCNRSDCPAARACLQDPCTEVAAKACRGGVIMRLGGGGAMCSCGAGGLVADGWEPGSKVIYCRQAEISVPNWWFRILG